MGLSSLLAQDGTRIAGSNGVIRGTQRKSFLDIDVGGAAIGESADSNPCAALTTQDPGPANGHCIGIGSTASHYVESTIVYISTFFEIKSHGNSPLTIKSINIKGCV
jgi:hypothetical protein